MAVSIIFALMLRVLISVLILFSFFMKNGGLTLKLQYEIWKLHHEKFEKRRHSKKVATFLLNDSEFSREGANADELKIDGHIFDIISIKKTDSNWLVLAMEDKEEDNFLFQIAENANDDELLKMKKSIVAFLDFICDLPSRFSIATQFYPFLKTEFCSLKLNWPMAFLTAHLPPPKFL